MKPFTYLAIFLVTCVASARDLRHLAPAALPDGLHPPKGLTVVDWKQIRAEHQRHRHTAFPGAGGSYVSRNREQQWRAAFDGRGFEIRPDSKTFTWGLELAEFAGQPVVPGAKVSVEKNRVSYVWSAGLRAPIEEWFLNESRGMEHGFTVLAQPAGGLRLTLQTRGTLRPLGAGSAIAFVDAAGKAAMHYSGLKAWDADGKTLPATMSTEGSKVRIVVDDGGARYPVHIDPVSQQAYLKPAAIGSNQSLDGFGYAVAISGDTVVVGSRNEDSDTRGVNTTPNELATDSGAVFVFVRIGSFWSQQAYLKPGTVGTTQAGDGFGSAVAIDGDTIVVGAPGEDSSGTGVEGQNNELATDSGAAYVFVRSAGTWSQQAYIKPAAVGSTQANDRFGTSVGINGNTIAVAAPFESGSNTGVNSTPNESSPIAGAIYAFFRTGTTWAQQAYLKPNAVGNGQANDGLGFGLAVGVDTIVGGSPGESTSNTGINPTVNEGAVNAGAAYVWTRSGSTWSQQAMLKPNAIGSTQAGDLFGAAVAIAGETVVVGAPFEDSNTQGVNTSANESATDTGAAYVFVRSGTSWSQQAYIKATAIGSMVHFGIATAISGNTAVIGSDLAYTTGTAFSFVRSGSSWSQDAEIKAANIGGTNVEDFFGGSVGISGDTVVVGAFGEDSNTTNINSLPNENANGAGAAYVYTGAGLAPSPLQFVPLAPCRLVDTRNANGPLGGPAIPALGTRNFNLRSACSVPSNAAAYSLNITVVPRGSLGYLTIWPGGLSQPLVSTLNSLDGRIKANAAIVPAGFDGSVNVFVTDLADVLLDVNGVFVPQGSNSSGQAFYPVTPCRIIDSRATGGGGTIAANATRNVIVATASGCGIPQNATAYATNVTVIPKAALGFLTLWPGGQTRPTVSTLNALTGTVTANLAIVPAGSNGGDVNAFVTDASDLIVDVTGYFGPPGGTGALNFYALSPCRVADTRNANGDLGGPMPGATTTREYPVLSSPCSVPATARAYSLNATVIPQPILGFLTLFPTGVTRPVVSTLNAVDGSLTANAAIVPAGTSGRISAYVTENTHLILDINGYFAP